MIRRLLSYIYPITVFKTSSDVSTSLELTWVNGRLLLDSENANYSYGSLQRVLTQGLKEIGPDKIAEMQKILVLGVAGGSVIKVLTDKFKFKGKITGVDIDPKVLEIAGKYYKLNEISNLELVTADAMDFVRNAKEFYDLVIIDIFSDKYMPGFLYDAEFIISITSILDKKGHILFNTIVLDDVHQKKNKAFVRQFPDEQFTVSVLPKMQEYNELIIVSKI